MDRRAYLGQLALVSEKTGGYGRLHSVRVPVRTIVHVSESRDNKEGKAAD